MKIKNILVLCEDLKYFDKWCNTIQQWHNKTADKHTRNTLQITTNEGTKRYIAYTPRMGKDVLLGLRFDDIIDNIGLSENERMWFNILIRPESENTTEIIFGD